MSLPTPPIAMPTSAFLSAGAIVHAVAYHADRQVFALIFANVFQFVLGQTVCTHLADMKLACNGFRGVFVVACEKHRLYAETCKRIDRGGAFHAQCVGKRKISCKLSVHCHIGDRATFAEIIHCVLRRCHGDTMFGKQLGIACKDGFAVHHGTDTAPGNHAEIGRRGRDGTGLDDCFSKRMLGKLFRRCRKTVDFVLVERL